MSTALTHRTRLEFLDGWRGLSIFLVLIGHFISIPGINLGRLGVELFFVLSGRLMAEILFIEKFPLGPFFKRRASRIIPALVVYLIISFIFLSGTFISFRLVDGLIALTFTYNYLGLLHRVPALDHIWSLCVEEHSYITLALVAYLATILKWRPINIIGALTIVSMINGIISHLIIQKYELTYWRTDVHISSILVSAWICIALKENTIFRHPPIQRYIAPLGAAIGMLMFIDAVPLIVRYTLGTSLLALSVNYLDVASLKIRSILSSKIIASMGLWSFSIYLWQQPFYKYVEFQHASQFLFLMAAILCGLLSFYLIENPARKWLNKNWK